MNTAKATYPSFSWTWREKAGRGPLLSEGCGSAFRKCSESLHADTESLDLARELGCDAVLTKGEFSSGLRRIVETEGAELKVRG